MFHLGIFVTSGTRRRSSLLRYGRAAAQPGLTRLAALGATTAIVASTLLAGQATNASAAVSDDNAWAGARAVLSAVSGRAVDIPGYTSRDNTQLALHDRARGTTPNAGILSRQA